jgi:hypothetical protein
LSVWRRGISELRLFPGKAVGYARRICSTRYSDVRREKARIEMVVVLSVQFGKTLASHT